MKDVEEGLLLGRTRSYINAHIMNPTGALGSPWESGSQQNWRSGEVEELCPYSAKEKYSMAQGISYQQTTDGNESEYNFSDTLRLLHEINELHDIRLRSSFGADVRSKFEQACLSDLEELNAILAEMAANVSQQPTGRVPSPQADLAEPTYEETDGNAADCDWLKTHEILNKVKEMNEYLCQIVDEEVGEDGADIKLRLLQSRVSFLEKLNAILLEEVELKQRGPYEASLRHECTSPASMVYQAVNGSRNDFWRQTCDSLSEVGKLYENALRRVDEELGEDSTEMKLGYLQSRVSYLHKVNASLLQVVGRWRQDSADGATLLQDCAQSSNQTPRPYPDEFDDDGEDVPAEVLASTSMQHHHNEVTIPLKIIIRARKVNESDTTRLIDIEGIVDKALQDGRISRDGLASVKFIVYAHVK